jgi:hypothetical protein
MKKAIERWLGIIHRHQHRSQVKAIDRWRQWARVGRTRDSIAAKRRAACKRMFMHMSIHRHRILVQGLRRWQLIIRVVVEREKAYENAIRKNFSLRLEQMEHFHEPAPLPLPPTPKPVILEPHDIHPKAEPENAHQDGLHHHHHSSHHYHHHRATNVIAHEIGHSFRHRKMRQIFARWKHVLHRNSVQLKLRSGFITQSVFAVQTCVNDVLPRAVPSLLLSPPTLFLDSSDSSGSLLAHSEGDEKRVFHRALLADRVLFLHHILRKLQEVLKDSSIFPSIFIADVLGDQQFVGLSALDPADARFLFTNSGVEQTDAHVHAMTSSADDRRKQWADESKSKEREQVVYLERGKGRIGQALSTGKSAAVFNRDISDRHILRVGSVICPILHDGTVIGLVHLCVSSPFAVAFDDVVDFKSFSRSQSHHSGKDHHPGHHIGYKPSNDDKLARGKESDAWQLIRDVCVQENLTPLEFGALLGLVTSLPSILGSHLELCRTAETLQGHNITERARQHQVIQAAHKDSDETRLDLTQQRKESDALKARVAHLTQSRQKLLQVATKQEEVSVIYCSLCHYLILNCLGFKNFEGDDCNDGQRCRRYAS